MRKAAIITGREWQQKYLPVGPRILLVAPPVYDFRLEWAKWHQPTGLLQVASLLRSRGKDIRLIDCLNTERHVHLPRRRLSIEEIEDYRFNVWHFGLPFEGVERRVADLLGAGWRPNAVFLTSLNSIYWEAVRDTVSRLRTMLPKANFILGGAYPTTIPEHAALCSGANVVVVGNVPAATRLAPDLSLYSVTPYSTGVYFYPSRAVSSNPGRLSPRPVRRIVREITQKAALGTREFVFFDEEIRLLDRDAFANLLREVARADLDVRFVLPGNVSPRFITQDLARKMVRARVTQVYLRCDLQFAPNAIQYETPLHEYERCVNALLKSGIHKPRTGTIAAMLVVGLPNEDLDAVCERLIQLGHIVGSVMLVPFQYVPGLHSGPIFDRALAQNGRFSPEKFNSKTFPLARMTGRSLEDYLELARLAALLNSKYRSRTFDFLGDGLAARLFRESLRTGEWNPFPDRLREDESSPLLPLKEPH